MVRGIYTAASAMMTQMAQQDIISNNLANLDTTGFKRDVVAFRARMDQNVYAITSNPGGGASVQSLGLLSTGATVDQISVSYSQGDLRPTENPLDLGLRGQGFLCVQTPKGVAYTRDGALQLDRYRRLVDAQGNFVLGRSGPIQFPPSGAITISEDGTISVGGKILGSLRLANFSNPVLQLTKEGDTYYHLNSGAELPAANLKVQQGFLEQSTVNPITEMVNMITAMRSYEGSQKALQTEDQELGRAVNDIARM